MKRHSFAGGSSTTNRENQLVLPLAAAKSAVIVPFPRTAAPVAPKQSAETLRKILEYAERLSK